MPESSITTLGGVNPSHWIPLDMHIFFDHHLGDSFAGGDGVWLIGEVDEDDADVATIIGIYSAWCVDERKTVLECEA